jgi:uncharacterized iron-regulated membrane protein
MASTSSVDPKAYRALWRWHFYAGLIVAPFLLILTVTGSIYLFNDEIDDALYPAQRFVAVHATQVPASRMIAAVLKAHPGAATRIDLPGAANRTASRSAWRWIQGRAACSARRSTPAHSSDSPTRCTDR